MKNYLKTPNGRAAEHIIVVFFGTFATTLLFNTQHALSGGGLSTWKAALPLIVVAAGYTAWAKVRPLISETAVEGEKASVQKKSMNSKGANDTASEGNSGTQ